MFGWTPAGVSQSLAEGHNDIVMVAARAALALPALRGRLAGAGRAGRVGPVQVRDRAAVPDRSARTSLRHERIGWPRYALRLVAPAVLGLGIMALFYRSPEFFDGVRLVSDWYFLQPRDAVQAIELTLGVSMLPMALAATALFPAYAAYTAWNRLERADHRAPAGKCALAVMSAVMFTAVSHLWSWYVIWALALAALVPSWWLSRFIVAVAILSPFTLGFWWVEPFANHREAVAFAMYALAMPVDGCNPADPARSRAGGAGACITTSHVRMCPCRARPVSPLWPALRTCALAAGRPARGCSHSC